MAVALLGPVLSTAGLLLHPGTRWSGVQWLLLDGSEAPSDRRLAGFGTAGPLGPLSDHTGHSWGGGGGGHRCSLQVTGVSGGSGVEANHNQFFPNFFCLLFLVFGCLVVSFSLRRLNVASRLNMFNFLFFNSVTKAS